MVHVQDNTGQTKFYDTVLATLNETVASRMAKFCHHVQTKWNYWGHMHTGQFFLTYGSVFHVACPLPLYLLLLSSILHSFWTSPHLTSSSSASSSHPSLSLSLPSAASNTIQGDKFTSSSREPFSPDLLLLAAAPLRTCKHHTQDTRRLKACARTCRITVTERGMEVL